MNVEGGMRNAEKDMLEWLIFMFPPSAFPIPNSKDPQPILIESG
jgi:hypothetical protein